MNKIKIYFYGDWAYIAPPWLPLADPLCLSTENKFNDIGINITKGMAYVTNDDYYCSVNETEISTLARMLEHTATIIRHRIKGDMGLSLLRSTFHDCEVYIVGETL